MTDSLIEETKFRYYTVTEYKRRVVFDSVGKHKCRYCKQTIASNLVAIHSGKTAPEVYHRACYAKINDPKA